MRAEHLSSINWFCLSLISGYFLISASITRRRVTSTFLSCNLRIFRFFYVSNVMNSLRSSGKHFTLDCLPKFRVLAAAWASSLWHRRMCFMSLIAIVWIGSGAATDDLYILLVVAIWTFSPVGLMSWISLNTYRLNL
jgi:hypothetical protein